MVSGKPGQAADYPAHGLQAQARGLQPTKSLVGLQRYHEHVTHKRKDYLNKIAFHLIHNYDMIAIEDLKITNMVKDHNLAMSILDGGWGYFAQRLADKAAEAGRELVRIAPAYTSKTCSGCGKIFEEQGLKDRWIECGCGLSLDRDINAALNILKKALTRDGQFRWELTWAAAPCVSQEAAAL